MPHALAPLTELPVLEVVSATHIVADLTLGLGKVVHDYLAPSEPSHRKERRYELRNEFPCARSELRPVISNLMA